MTLLVEIDPVVRAEADERARRGQWKGNLGAQEENLLSRVELIGRTVEVLRRLHSENEQRKLIIDQLLQQKRSGAMTRLNLPSMSVSFILRKSCSFHFPMPTAQPRIRFLMRRLVSPGNLPSQVPRSLLLD